jgi:hypothetical protein
MSFKVGDILWVVGRERPGVRVYQVVEELTKKTLSGTITTFKTRTLAPPGKAKKVTIDSLTLEGEIFTDVLEARKDMLQRTEVAIDKMIQANKNLINKFGNKKEDSEEAFGAKVDISKEQNDSIVTLPDGTEARLKINLGSVL